MSDGENTYLTAEAVNDDNESPINHLQGSSITYRIAMGQVQGRKAFTLQTPPDCEADNPNANQVGEAAD